MVTNCYFVNMCLTNVFEREGWNSDLVSVSLFGIIPIFSMTLIVKEKVLILLKSHK